MTSTPCKQAVIALAARLDVCASEPSRTPCQTLREAAQALRHLASQSSSYEAGLRDMRERCREAVSKIVENYKLLDGSQTLASTHAAKCLAAIASLPADGGEGTASNPINMDESRERLTPSTAGSVREALERVIESAERALGEHVAPHDCYATGPSTGDPVADLVSCPGCVLKHEIEEARLTLLGGSAR